MLSTICRKYIHAQDGSVQNAKKKIKVKTLPTVKIVVIRKKMAKVYNIFLETGNVSNAKQTILQEE